MRPSFLENCMSLDIFELFATNEKLETVGVWHNLNADGSSRIKVARMDNPKYQQAMQLLYSEYAEELQKEPEAERLEPDSLTRKIMAKGMAQAILVDWEGISYKGKVLKYTKENAEKVLMHKDFLELVLRLSSDIANFRLELEEEQTKN